MAQATLSCRFAAIHLVAPAPRFCLWKNACTAQERRGPEGPLGGFPVSSPKAENIDFNRPCQKGRTSYRKSFLFGFRPSKAASTLRNLNDRERQSRPSGVFTHGRLTASPAWTAASCILPNIAVQRQCAPLHYRTGAHCPFSVYCRAVICRGQLQSTSQSTMAPV